MIMDQSFGMLNDRRKFSSFVLDITATTRGSSGPAGRSSPSQYEDISIEM
jgi:hypothetical protein